jgi:hypothetical protein
VKAQKAVKNLSDQTSAKDLSELRERVVRLEVQMADVIKRLDSINNYTRQLYEYLNKSR